MCHHVSIVLPNRPGELKTVAAHLSAAGINVLGHQLSSQGNSCTVSILCETHDAAFEILRREYRFYCNQRPVIIVRIAHEPGQLKTILEALSQQDLNIESSYQALSQDEEILLVVELRDRDATKQAESALRDARCAVLDAQP